MQAQPDNIEALKRDAARYRWLRDASQSDEGFDKYWEVVNELPPEDWDKAIDSALAAP